MFNNIIASIVAAALLAGCVGHATPETLATLQAHQAACKAGDGLSCGYAVQDLQLVKTEEAADAEVQRQQGAAIAGGILGILLGAAIAADHHPHAVYVRHR